MSLRKLITIVVLLVVCCGFVPLQAQESAIYTTEIAAYRKGKELFDKEQYGAAFKQFNTAIETIGDLNAEVSVESEYYAALCALELFNKDAEYLLKQFIQRHPESPKVKHAYFQLGNYNYRKQKWDKVLAWFGKVNIYDLNNEELAEYYFKKGYSHFKLGDLEQASKMLYEIKDAETAYYVPAQYYYAHIAYEQGNYETALTGFYNLQNDPLFGPIVPYYITQIYYIQEKDDQLIAYASPMLDSAAPRREAEIAKLVGEAYVRKEAYSEAIPFLVKYHTLSTQETLDDVYQLGYAYYKAGVYNEAILMFSRLTSEDNLRAQTTLYHLGDCYIQLDKKVFARNAFLSASNMEYDPKITEDALFKYAQLSYELAYDPYGTVIGVFQKYIKKYPNSVRSKDAYDYLVNIYLTSSNYEAALKSIEEIKNPDIRLQRVYQQVAYNRGIEQYNNKRWTSAIAYLLKSHKYPVDSKLKTLSHYWVAEAQYKRKDYDAAIESYKEFIFGPGAILNKEFVRVNYNIGYAYFKQKQYKDAQAWFRKFINSGKDADQTLRNDAFIRIGDCFFIQTDYYAAIEYYEQAIQIGQSHNDYALYQKGMCYGPLKKPKEKVKYLTRMLDGYSTSEYVDDAKYELGRAYISLQDQEKTLFYMNDIVNNHPRSPYVKRALVNIGQTFQNNGKLQEAEGVYMRIIQQYSSYQDIKEAIAGLTAIYTDQGREDELEALLDGIDSYDLSALGRDTLQYNAQETRYFNEEWQEAANGFSKYLDRFDNAIFKVKAHFYRAQSLNNLGKEKEALPDYIYVAEQPWNDFSESSMIMAARLSKKHEGCAAAIPHLTRLEETGELQSYRLEAQLTLLECYEETKEHEKVIEYADRIMKARSMDQEVIAKAHLSKAKALIELGDLDRALIECRITSAASSSIVGTEAQYLIAEIYFRKDQFKESEDAIYELIEGAASHPDWNAKGLILLSDIFVTTGDLFQAKTTLENIVNNYEGPELPRAQSKLDTISQMEVKEEMMEEQDDELEIEFENNPDDKTKEPKERKKKEEGEEVETPQENDDQ